MILKKGSRGSQVVSLQRQLQFLGYNIGSWGADGDFGTSTLKAVKAFQKDKGLVVDGLVGPATRAALFVAKQLPVTPKDDPVVPDPKLPDTSPIVTPSNHHYIFRSTTHVTEVEPLLLRISPETDQPGYAYTGDNLMTAAFLGHHSNKSTYPTSMLASEGRIINNMQPNGLYSGEFKGKGIPAPTFIVLRDGSCTMEITNDISNIHDLWFAVSGLGLIPRTDQGFPGSFAKSVGYRTFRVGLGYNPQKHRVLMVYNPSMAAGSFAKILQALGCTMGLCTDSGGSAVYKQKDKFIRSTTRRLPAMIEWS